MPSWIPLLDRDLWTSVRSLYGGRILGACCPNRQHALEFQADASERRVHAAETAERHDCCRINPALRSCERYRPFGGSVGIATGVRPSRAVCVQRLEIPTGFCLKAQGCESASYPGREKVRA